jgi:hypothetical protein
MKHTIFKCDPLAPRAMLALQKHRDTYPDGVTCFSGRSNRAIYVSLGYVVYETKTTVVIDKLGE